MSLVSGMTEKTSFPEQDLNARLPAVLVGLDIHYTIGQPRRIGDNCRLMWVNRTRPIQGTFFLGEIVSFMVPSQQSGLPNT